MARQDKIITALDIGTTAVRAVIARIHPEHGIRICGVGEKISEGMRKSMILDAESLVPLITSAIEAAEKEANVEVSEVYASIGGHHIHSTNGNAVMPILDNDETVSEKHIGALREKVRNNYQERGRTFLHVIPQEYRLDGSGRNQSPIGLEATRIEMFAHLISADTKILQNQGHVINDAGFKVVEMCFSGIADGHCVLTDEEKKDGVLLIDIGGGSCSYLLYLNNTVNYSNVFAVGGDHITNDLALGLNLSITDAERLKCTYSHTLKSSDKGNDSRTVTVEENNNKKRKVMRADIEMIIESRMEETLKFISDDIDQYQLKRLIGRGVVCTGGVTKSYCFTEMAEDIFGSTVRLAKPVLFRPEQQPNTIDFVSDSRLYLADPTFTTVMGLLRYAVLMQAQSVEKRPGLLHSLFSR